MVLVTSVFLTQLLCLLVPCDPQYQLPDVRPVEKKELENEWAATQFEPKTEKELQQTIQELQIQQPSQGHQTFIDVHQLNSRSTTSLLYSNECLDEHPYVTTNSGSVEGYRIQVVGGRKICAFEGIPFGESPTGKLRFMSPVPKSKWKGILKATRYGPQCLQYNVPQAFRTVGVEDCLT